MMTVLRSLLMLSAAAFLTSASTAREFTNTKGQKIEAEIIEVTGEGDSQMVTLRRSDGNKFTIAANTLSEADQGAINEFIAAQAELAVAAVKSPSVFDDVLDGKLVKLEGRKVSKFEMTAEPDYYAFYFSASWCGPCRAFTPDLVKFYKRNKEAGKKFEIIFVSSDNDEDSMEEYMKDDDFPFPAMKYRYARERDIRKYAGAGIPCLVMVDRDGNVVSDSYVEGKYVGPRKVLDDLKKAVK